MLVSSSVAGWPRNLPTIISWVEAQKPGEGGVNIITSDFVELTDFVNVVIKLNNLLLSERGCRWHVMKVCWHEMWFGSQVAVWSTPAQWYHCPSPSSVTFLTNVLHKWPFNNQLDISQPHVICSWWQLASTTLANIRMPHRSRFKSLGDSSAGFLLRSFHQCFHSSCPVTFFPVS